MIFTFKLLVECDWEQEHGLQLCLDKEKANKSKQPRRDI
jgi:hypothetical protein